MSESFRLQTAAQAEKNQPYRHIYIYVYVYIYTHTHTHTHTQNEEEGSIFWGVIVSAIVRETFI